MSIAFQPMLSVSALALSGMTFPKYRHLLSLSDPRVAGVVALQDGMPVALALAAIQKDTATLLSLYVSEDHRRQGTGAATLTALEAEVAGRGCGGIETVWMSAPIEVNAFAFVLQRLHWSSPQARMHVYRATCDSLASVGWIRRFADLPFGHSIVPWQLVTPAQLTRLKQAIRFESWIPADLDPFAFAGDGFDGAPSEPALNLACIANDEVVGWNLAHRIDAACVRVSCTYVRPALQAQLLMLAMWRDFFERLSLTAYQQVSWAVSVEREAMIRFNEKFMLPYTSASLTSWGSNKSLVLGA
ncbi:MAG: GNAT family N-acetyltransferase [Pseudomonadota bacterium]